MPGPDLLFLELFRGLGLVRQMRHVASGWRWTERPVKEEGAVVEESRHRVQRLFRALSGSSSTGARW